MRSTLTTIVGTMTASGGSFLLSNYDRIASTAIVITLLGLVVWLALKARQYRAEAVAAMEHAHKIANAAMRGAPKVLFARRDIAPGQPQEWLYHIRIEGEEHLFPERVIREGAELGRRLLPTPKINHPRTP